MTDLLEEEFNDHIKGHELTAVQEQQLKDMYFTGARKLAVLLTEHHLIKPSDLSNEILEEIQINSIILKDLS